jgi:hypothetical protein
MIEPWYMLFPFIQADTLFSWDFGVFFHVFPRPTIYVLQFRNPVWDLNLILIPNLQLT